jgi:two-component system, OmpR family, response regulator
MLVLSRRLSEKIVFPGLKTAVQVVSIKPGIVRLGVEAPPNIVVLREELQERTAQWSAPASEANASAEAKLQRLMELLRKRLKVTAAGLAALQQQLEAGLVEESQAILSEIGDDLHLLEERVAEEVEKRTDPQGHKRCKALLVEDNRNERELLASVLRMSGVDVDTAGDGTDALDYLRVRGRPDVVLLDMGLPRCDGATAVHEIRQNPAFNGLKIFAVSGHLPEEYGIEKGPRGIDRWFAKPLDTSALLRDLSIDFDR